MSLYVIRVRRVTDSKDMPWYFDNKLDFDNALAAAKSSPYAVVTDHRADFTSTSGEFANWLRNYE